MSKGKYGLTILRDITHKPYARRAYARRTARLDDGFNRSGPSLGRNKCGCSICIRIYAQKHSNRLSEHALLID